MGFPQLPPDPMVPPGAPMGPPGMVGQRPPSGGTAITAGVLAVLGGLTWLAFTFLMWVNLTDDFELSELIVSFATALVAVDLIAGGIVTFFRARAGTVLVTIGCACVIVLWVVAMGFLAFYAGKDNLLGMSGEAVGSMAAGVAVLTALTVVPASLTMYMALCRSTKQWIRSKPQKTLAQAYGAYGQYG